MFRRLSLGPCSIPWRLPNDDEAATLKHTTRAVNLILPAGLVPPDVIHVPFALATCFAP
jgi:hypothetical protein